MDDILAYDDTCFISPGLEVRHKFLREWLQIPGSVSRVSLDEAGKVTGYGCRRPCKRPGVHIMGPVYADSIKEASMLIRSLMKDIEGQEVLIPIV